MGSVAGEAGLWGFHDRLSSRFRELHVERRKSNPDAPVFALEHGLGDTDLADLQERVRSGLRQDLAENEAWLPFVVYAAEVGYRYSGSAYWPTFSEQTPGWARHGDKYRLRSWFSRFADWYGGAPIAGRWAEQFPLIAWPVTHAVLPTDLQSKLAKLLFDSRGIFSPSALSSPKDLGQLLAQQAKQVPSARFQHFAENFEMLGYIASALLTGDEEESPYLSKATLHRIVLSLSRDSETRGWLGDAKSAARQSRRRQQTPRTRGAEHVAEPRGFRRPRLSLRRSLSGWGAFVDFPQLETLLAENATLADEFRSRRCIVDGAARILPPGELVRTSRPLNLKSWPSRLGPFLQVENGTRDLNHFLSETVFFPDETTAVFEVHNHGFASHRQTRRVRPGARYLVLAEALDVPTREWIEEVPFLTHGRKAALVCVPENLAADSTSILAAIGLQLSVSLQVSPAGVVPLDWDGVSEVTWLSHDPHMLRIQSPLRLDHLVVAVDGVHQVISWRETDPELWLDLGTLGTGTHEVTFQTPDQETTGEIELSLTVHVVGAMVARSSGEPGEAVRLLANSSTPTLPGLWHGDERLDFFGPDGVRAEVAASLYDRHESLLAVAQGRVKLPTWGAHLADLINLGEIDGFQRQIQAAESLRVSVTAPPIGSADITIDRGFEALRWIINDDPAAPTVVLADNTDAGSRGRLYTYEQPAKAVPLEADVATALPVLGGLVVAEASHEAALLLVAPLPNTIREHRDIVPTVAPSRNASHLLELMNIANMWAQAEGTEKTMSDWQRQQVVRVITVTLARSIQRSHWSLMDLEITTGKRQFNQSHIEAAFRNSSQTAPPLAPTKQSLYSLVSASVEGRVPLFASMIRTITSRMPLGMTRDRLARLTLMAASDPPALIAATTPGERQVLMGMLLTHVDLLSLARLVVLTLDDAMDDGSGYFGDWKWA